ncbi:MAG TPA: hypothetical protein VHO67_13995 [Polyangia bacterium]|nr:hypothetical protein [Polyangia bacterium]
MPDRLRLAAVVMAVLTAGCASRKPAAGDPPAMDAGAVEPFQPDPPAVYVAKVKNLLVGLPPTDEEVAAVTADPGQLRPLIQGWMALPQYAQKMLRFFELAFQQTQISSADYNDQMGGQQISLNATTTPLLQQNLQESFGRTVLQLVADDKPLSEAMSTPSFMMTTALKELYAFLDVWQVDDNGKVTDRFKAANPGLQITVGAAAGAVAIADTLNPASASYMHWYDPDVATANATVAGCQADPIVYPVRALTLHWLMLGSLDGRKLADGTNCPPVAGTATAPQLTAGDFSDWKMVTVRAPSAGEATTTFYDLPSLRAASTLTLSVPRVGFFSTPAFFANWQTNTSNQMRVTMNQALIVALGTAVDGSDPTVSAGPVPGLDIMHAQQPACVVCHRTLDPLRSIFSATYSWNYHNQVDATWKAQPGLFVFQGVIQPVSSMADLGAALAQHPLLPQAWVQKLCTYATSAACATDDPEFQRLVAAFHGSGLSWNTLVTELFSSPLVTNAAPTKAAAAGDGTAVAVSRRDHLCAALNARLGFADVCALNAPSKKQLSQAVPQIASGLPSDGYGRGATMPVLPNAPTLFYRSGVENICASVAAQVIDVAASKQVAGVKAWSSANPDAAIAEFVSLVMGLTSSDPRAAQATSILQAHFAAARQQGATATAALQSTFVAACLAPSATAIGM